MRIYLIRHGESTANREKAFQGWNNVHLSDQGRIQAKKLSEYFIGENIQLEQMFSSPLLRAMETADPLRVCSVNADIVSVDGFRSINVGEWGGLTIDRVKQEFPKEYNIWKHSPTKFRFPNGESLTDVHNRSQASLIHILHKYIDFGGNIAIVSHMITIKVLALWMLGKDQSNIWKKEYTVPNTGIMVFKVEKEESTDFNFQRVEINNPIPHLESTI